MVQIERGVEAAAGGIVVHDLDVPSGGPGAQVLPWHLVGDLADEGGLQLGGQAGIERVAAQQPVRGRRRHGGGGPWRFLRLSLLGHCDAPLPAVGSGSIRYVTLAGQVPTRWQPFLEAIQNDISDLSRLYTGAMP